MVGVCVVLCVRRRTKKCGVDGSPSLRPVALNKAGCLWRGGWEPADVAALDGARSKNFTNNRENYLSEFYAIREMTVKVRNAEHTRKRRERESDFIPHVAEKRALFSFRATGIE